MKPNFPPPYCPTSPAASRLKPGVQLKSEAPIRIGPATPVGAGVYRIEARSGAGKVGSVELGPVRSGSAEIKNLNVVQAFRRQGIGTKIINATVAAARGLGVQRLVLVASPTDAALPAHALRGMYAMLGFQQTSAPGLAHPVMQRSIGGALRATAPASVTQRMKSSVGKSTLPDDGKKGSVEKKSGPSISKRFGIKIGSHVRGDIVHFAAVAASLPGATFAFEPYDHTLWFQKRSEIEQWMHFLELNGAEFSFTESEGALDDAGEATLSLVRSKRIDLNRSIDLSPQVFYRPYHTDRYLKELLELKCPGIVSNRKKVLVWVRQKDSYAIYRNSPSALLNILVGLVNSCGMEPILIGDEPTEFPKKSHLNLIKFWEWEEVIPGPVKIRKRPFGGVDSMQRQIMFLDLLRRDYGVCAQIGVKSGAMDVMGFCNMKTVVIDLERDTRLHLRMARFSTVASNYFIVYPNYETEDETLIFSETTGTLVLHRAEELNPSKAIIKVRQVKNQDVKRQNKAEVEYAVGEVKDWEEVVIALLKK